MLKNPQKNNKLDYFGSMTFYLFSIVVLLVGQAFAGVVSAALSKTVPDIADNGDFNTACMVFFQLLNAVFIFSYLRLKKCSPNFSIVHSSESGRGVTAAVIIVPIVAAVVLMIGMYLPTAWYGFFTQAIGIPPDAGSIDIKTPSAVVMLVISTVILAPMFEETIYRGVLLHGLRQEKSAVAAVLLSALAFMLMHLNPLQVVFQFALGAVAAIIVLKTKRLISSVILHASSNALALVIEFTPFADVMYGCVSWLTAHVAAAVFITLGLLVGAGGILYVLIRFGLKERKAVSAAATQTEEIADTVKEQPEEENITERHSEANAETVELDPSVVEAERANAEKAKQFRKRDASVRYYIGIAICAVTFIVNLVALILSSHITI